MNKITHIFFDVGGVCLTNGWDSEARKRASEHFSYNLGRSEDQHEQIAEKFETGRISRDDYLNKVIFYKDRPFSKETFISFMESQSQAHGQTFELLKKLSQNNNYQLATINNESFELNLFRIKKFELHQYFSSFFSSCFLGIKKPDPEIFKKVLWITHKKGEECLFIDDREENTEAARRCGYKTIHLETVSDLKNKLYEKGVGLTQE